MDEKQYMQQRVDDQFNWLDRKAGIQQRSYKRIRTIIIIISVLIPLAAGFITDELWWLKLAVGTGGAVVAIFQGILAMQKYHELWLQYRVTAEALKREKFLYLTRAGKYHHAKNPFNDFVINIEAILANENAAWLQQLNEKEEEKDSV